MARSRHCSVCGEWHDLSAEWPEACLGHYRVYREQEAHIVVKDIEPYKSMITGEVIGGRKQHRDHLRAHNMVEVGNETKHMRPKPFEPDTKAIRAALKESYEYLRSGGQAPRPKFTRDQWERG